MKIFMIIATTAFLALLPQESQKLKGNYKVQFDKKYQLEGYNISFSETAWMKRMPDAVTYNGKIKYGKYLATIQQNEDDNPIEIDNREFAKDTMKFSTKNKRDTSLTINRGVMIKVK